MVAPKIRQLSQEPETGTLSGKTNRIPVQQCPVCGTTMVAISGSRLAICANCGYKDSCC